jgi:FkbM family methyltransferase
MKNQSKNILSNETLITNNRKSINYEGTFLERIIRAHPLIYIIFRFLIRFTSIFEKDFDGLKLLNFNEKINILDIGASDGIAAKFFNNNLKTDTIYCFEPNKGYVNLLRKIKIKNVIIKPFAIGNQNSHTNIMYPRYKFFNKFYDIITYTFYDIKHLNHFLLDFKFRKNISIVKKKLLIRKVKKFNKKIHLVKIDTNGFELSVIKSLINTIKKDKPALIVEDNVQTKDIYKILKKYSYKSFYYSTSLKKFTKIQTKYSLNKYYLQSNHLK